MDVNFTTPHPPGCLVFPSRGLSVQCQRREWMAHHTVSSLLVRKKKTNSDIALLILEQRNGRPFCVWRLSPREHTPTLNWVLEATAFLDQKCLFCLFCPFRLEPSMSALFSVHAHLNKRWWVWVIPTSSSNAAQAAGVFQFSFHDFLKPDLWLFKN